MTRPWNMGRMIDEIEHVETEIPSAIASIGKYLSRTEKLTPICGPKIGIGFSIWRNTNFHFHPSTPA